MDLIEQRAKNDYAAWWGLSGSPKKDERNCSKTRVLACSIIFKDFRL